MQGRGDSGWREATDLIITPDLQAIEWNGFESGPELVKAGAQAALAALPEIQSWMAGQCLDADTAHASVA
jgi:hypothetical protein